ncbi:sodium-dependent transporter [Enemella evansiae]|uniref:sodium-dependent transporter n=1 Tax=Enemella evansiae TaxID=2016499 RepID=UPI00105CCACE|nr:sodium-dependent transporter [Enemella evansiae]TDO84807.1 NSS family neurotransmitter:Na+ symporter [Enemella evansiae]
MTTTQSTKHTRGGFSSQRVFILTAIGSAVGLGNIWRFPYVAYENGGGSFLIPYLCALLFAGLPFLFLDYALGHRFRGSTPLSFARLSRRSEGLGWWQVLICAVIAVYYAAIIAWAGMYAVFSIGRTWGEDTESYFFKSFLQAGDPGLSLTFVPQAAWPLAVVWIVLLGILLLGVQRGIGATSVVFIPVLMLVFLALVVQALLLPGAVDGLNALFTPKWSALLDPSVWVAAFGQIFFSLSVGFGIMITYASYMSKKTDLTGSGLVVGFANSGFELLAGIGVFSALGFMAQASGKPVAEVVASGLGMAFVAFPTIINAAPAGSLLGVLFFASLVLAGITSLVSVLEVAISAVRDKFDLPRVAATLWVGVPLAVISMLLLGTSTAVYALDVLDHFINNFGILLVAIVSMLVITWGIRAIPMLRAHLNANGSVPIGRWWLVLLGVVTPLVLVVNLVQAFLGDVAEPYEGYPGWLLGTLGWGVAAGVLVLGFLLALLPWRTDAVNEPPTEPDGTPQPDDETAPQEAR